MFKIEITSGQFKHLQGKNAVTGKPYDLRVQVGYFFPVDKDTGEVAKYPEKFEFFLEDDAKPFAPGVYQLAPSAVYVSREGRLSISPRLAPVSQPVKA